MSRSRPASVSSTFSTGIAAIVVQLGFAMMPLRASAIACGLTSLTTSGTSGSMRHALELSMTTAPASAKRGACARLPVAPAENRAMSMPAGLGGRDILDDRRPGPANSTSVPAERAVAKSAELADRERRAPRESRRIDGADLAGGADDGDGES